MNRIIFFSFISILTMNLRANNFFGDNYNELSTIINDNKQDNKIVTKAIITFVPENIDTAMFYIRGIVAAFNGNLVKDNPDTMIITIMRDSLDRTFYFLNKLGTITNKDVKSKDETSVYYEIKEKLTPLLEERKVYTKELRDAEEQPEAIVAENKILKINKIIDPLIKEFRRIEYGSKYTYIVIHFKK